MRPLFALCLLLPLGCTGDDGDTDPGDTDDTDTPDDSGTPPDDTGTPCDKTVPSIALPAFVAEPEMTRIVLAPADLDPESDNYAESQHVLYLPTDPDVPVRDELLLFLPGTASHGDDFDDLLEIAVQAGYPVLSLAYDAEIDHAEYCADVPFDEMAACREAVIQEKIYGTDASDLLEVGEADSIVGRTKRVLQAVAERYPEAGADRFMNGNTPAWDRMVLAGLGQGAVLAGYLSKNETFARVAFFAGGCDALTTGDGGVVLAPWCAETRATPAEVAYALSHVDDDRNENATIHTALGILFYGDYAWAARESPTYCTGTHAILSDLKDANGGDEARLSIAEDGYVPLDQTGVPVLAEDYYWLFGGGV